MALPPIGFWSYSTHDEVESNGRISRLHDFVQRELRQKMGRGQTVDIWRDTSAMRSGAAWEAEINRAVDRASFLIAVVTPDFLNSKWCCHEVMRFHARVDAMGRTDLLFPLHVVDTDDLGHDEVHDPALLDLLRARQMVDFRKHRLKPVGHADVEAALDRFTTDIRVALRVGRLPPAPVLPVQTASASGSPPAPPVLPSTPGEPHQSPSANEPPLRVPDPGSHAPFPEAQDSPETGLRPSHQTTPSSLDQAGALSTEPKTPLLRSRSLGILGASLIAGGIGIAIGMLFMVAGTLNAPHGADVVNSGDKTASPTQNSPPRQEPSTAPSERPLPRPPDPPRNVPTATAQPQPAPRCPQCPEMVLIPGGAFTMGDKERSDSQPETPITIKPFFMAKYPLTVGEYRAFLTARPTYQAGDNWKDAAKDPAPRLPAVTVNQADCKAYHDWLNDLIRPQINARRETPYRLPSESEWEYAARAGNQAAYFWGDRFEDGEAGRFIPPRNKGAVAAETLAPNKFGLHGMLGLVWQWVEDPWHEDYKGRPRDESVWTAGGDPVRWVLRGGSWYRVPRDVRAAVRGGLDGRYSDTSCRLARTSF